MLARAALIGPAGRWLSAAGRAASRALVDRVVDHVHVGTQHLRRSELGLGASVLVPHLCVASTVS